MANILRIDFLLLGTEMSPREISERTGIVPDVELRQGERNLSLNLPRQHTWKIGSKLNSEELEEHWKELESILLGAKDEIRSIAKSGRVELVVAVVGDGRIPSIRIPVKMSEFAGYVGAIVDIDHLQY